MVRHQARYAIAAALVVVLTSAGAWKKYKGKAEDVGQGSVKVERGDIELHFMDSGELTPKTYVDVASKVSGRVIELFVPLNSKKALVRLRSVEILTSVKSCVAEIVRFGSVGLT